MDAINALIEVLANHPDNDGSLTTSDLPEFVVERAWYALEDEGDDLSAQAGGPCRAMAVPGKHAVLVRKQDDGWTVSYLGDRNHEIGWRYQTPAEIERALRMVVGNRPAELAMLRDAVEDVWTERQREVAQRNAARESGWERMPRRSDDEIIGEALMRYRKRDGRSSRPN